MRYRKIAAGLAILLSVLITVAPTHVSFPRKAQAGILTEIIADIGLPATWGTWIESKWSATSNARSLIKESISASANVANQASLKLLVADKYIIKPLAYVLSGNLLKSMTSSVVSFVAGESNGTGKPQFVQNVNGLMQRVGDKQASVFFAQLTRSNSPFAAAVASSLRTNYLQQTSASGFFAANQDTLSRTSPDINAFLSGDWSKGGVKSWFALTTRPENNPYLLYANSQSQLATLVGTAQSAKKAELDWGQGFLSWCEPEEADPSALVAEYTEPECTSKDGAPGKIQTPGSYIKDALMKAVGMDQDKLAAAGEAGSEINSIFSSISSALDKVNISFKLMGGMGNSLGLAGASQSSSGGRSVLGAYQSTPGYMGATAATVLDSASGLPTSGGEFESQVAHYRTAWDTITAAINFTQANATAFVQYCPDQAGAVGGVNQQIQSARTKSAAAATIVTNATAAIHQLQTNLNAGNVTDGEYVRDMQALQTMRPTTTDVAQAESDAESAGIVTAANLPYIGDASSLSLIDQMKLIDLRIRSLETTCLQARVARYQAAWNVIGSAANTAQEGITAILNSCPNQASAVAGYLPSVHSVRSQAAAAAQVIAQATGVSSRPYDVEVDYIQAQAGTVSTTTTPTLLSQMNSVNSSVQSIQVACGASIAGPPPIDAP